jgi:Zn-dependent protease/predicted transcriptional regulator
VTPSIRLGRIFGIEVGLNWSLIFIFAFMTWTVATVLPQAAPGYSDPTYWVAGLAGAVAFYACLLAHELSHALVSRRQGVRVAGITLWLFGGVARLDGEPKSARSEALIAGVGPLTSLVIGSLALGIAFALPDSFALLANLLAWLGLVNFMLAAFNLVPAFPLDGGRLLSAMFWWRSGSRQRGVHNAVRIARVIAFLMIAAGVISLFAGLGVQGIWIAFIGWFLLSAGAAEEAGTTVRGMLMRVPVSAAMSSPVVTVPDWITIAQFLEAVAPQHAFTTYPVHEPSGKLTGVVRLGDLVRIAASERNEKHLIDAARPIAEVPTTTPDEDLGRLLERVGPTFDQRVLVFDHGSLVGILSPVDVARLVGARQTQA